MVRDIDVNLLKSEMETKLIKKRIAQFGTIYTM